MKNPPRNPAALPAKMRRAFPMRNRNSKRANENHNNQYDDEINDMNKKETRQNFRNVCFVRDHYSCVMCGYKSNKENCENELDVHHIISRKIMPNGGYVLENGISLCNKSHIKAEDNLDGYTYDILYNQIKSSKELARAASLKLIERK